jgi:hypothetical protein
LEQAGTDSGHAIEPCQTAKRAMRLPFGYDDLGQSRTDSGKPGQLCNRRQVDVDPLSATQRFGLPHGTVSLAQWGARWQRCKQLNLSRWFSRPGEKMPHTLARHRQSQEQQHGPRFGWRHGGRVRELGRF